jgi:hypothetical protein
VEAGGVEAAASLLRGRPPRTGGGGDVPEGAAPSAQKGEQMERERVMAALAHARSPEQERAALEHLRRWVQENPEDEHARELLAAADAGDWETVVAQLGEEADR